MDNFGFEPFAGGMDFTPVSESFEHSVGPYIPEVRECMTCGACLGSCPTYKVRPEESYAPRGRVRMIERVLKQEAVLAEDELAAFDACTQCMACETACPSRMDYSGLYRQAVEAMDAKPKQSVALRMVFNLVAAPRWVQRLMGGMIRFYQRVGLSQLVRLLPLNGGISQLEQVIPENHVSQRVSNYSPATANAQRGEVTLFTGCIANIFDTQTHNATITLLNHLGYAVRVLQHQTCCGAVYAHNGELEQAKTCARQNIDSISKCDGTALIFNSSGCGAFLKDYASLLSDDDCDIDSQWSATDIIDFLSEAGRLDELKFKPLNLKVAVHEPCSQRNILKNHEAVYELLKRIPGLDVLSLPHNNICCGAGGTKMLTQPELANPLRDEKVKAFEESGADLLVSTNLACAMHLSNGTRDTDRNFSVMHVVDLLARQLP